MNKKFRTRLFGFKKKDVISYLSEYSLNTEKTLNESSDLIDDLKKENEELKTKIADLEEKNLFVGNAILNAERKANEIIVEAQSIALNKKKEIDAEIKHSTLVLKKLNEEIKILRSNLMTSVNKYQNELDNIISLTDDIEE